LPFSHNGEKNNKKERTEFISRRSTNEQYRGRRKNKSHWVAIFFSHNGGAHPDVYFSPLPRCRGTLVSNSREYRSTAQSFRVSPQLSRTIQNCLYIQRNQKLI
jgi:hypothetical protein